jgi:3D (Asp-Asp-Asp) domain-containing protein
MHTPRRTIAALAATAAAATLGAEEAQARTARVTSTAYCLHGRMANGRFVHVGAVAVNFLRLGSRIRASRSPYGRHRRFRVEDRIGYGTQLDFWVPSCAAARAWGRRTVLIHY